MSNYHGGRLAAYYDETMRDDAGFFIGVSEEHQPGYWTDPARYETSAQAKAAADAYNERLGLTPKDALLIVASSMFHYERHFGPAVAR